MSRRHQFMLPTKGESTPASIPGLVVWWDALLSPKWQETDGTTAATNTGLLGRIDDLTGNGFHLAATADAARPDYYSNALDLGVPAIFFAGSGERLFNSALAAELAGNPPSFTVFMVWQTRRPLSSTAGVVWGVMTDGGALASDPNIYVRCAELNTNAATPFIRFARRNAAGVTTNTDSAVGFGGASRPMLLVTVVNGDTSRTTFQNGISAATVAASIGELPFTTSDHFALNALWDGTNPLVNGAPAWFFGGGVINRAIGTAEHAAINRYYASRLRWSSYVHGVTAVKTFVFGDSHSEGHNDQAPSADNNTATYWNRAFRYLPFAYTAKPLTRAVSGARFTLTDANNDIRDYYETAKTLIASGDLVVICGGQNDINDNNPTTGVAPTTEAEVEEMIDFEIMGEGEGAEATNFKTCVSDAIARGADVVVLTVPPRANLSDILDAGIAYMGDRQKEYAYRFDRTAVHDWWDQLRTGGTNELNQTSYESAEDDEIHLNSAAHILGAQGLATELAHLRSFNPATYADTVRYWTARQGAQFEDAGAIGDTGEELLDLSTTGDDATQSTAGARPSWNIEIHNTRPAVSFDGSADFLACTEATLPAWFVLYSTAGMDYSAANPLLGDDGGSSKVELLTATTTRVTDTDGEAITFTHAARTNGDVELITSAGEHYLNGTLSSASGALTGSLKFDRIGTDGTNFFDGDLLDLCIGDAAPSTPNRNLIGAYFARKMNKTWS